jgi:hypothetical protein
LQELESLVGAQGPDVLIECGAFTVADFRQFLLEPRCPRGLVLGLEPGELGLVTFDPCGEFAFGWLVSHR